MQLILLWIIYFLKMEINHDVYLQLWRELIDRFKMVVPNTGEFHYLSGALDVLKKLYEETENERIRKISRETGQPGNPGAGQE